MDEVASNKQLDEGEMRFRQLAEQPIAGVFILQDECFKYVNPEFSRIVGYSADELQKRHLIDLIVEEDKEAIRTLVSRRLGGLPARGRSSIRALRVDGAVIELQMYAARVDLDEKAAFMGVVVDMTERKRAENELREREEHLRHAQKLEAVGRLAGGIAHDFNNLLMVIRGSVNLILMDPESQDNQGNLEEIVRATERAASLTRQLLAFSRKQVLRPVVINLNDALADLHRIMARLIGEEIELVMNSAPNLSSVRVDPGQLEQVVLNLVVNARDAMPTGGRIAIRTSNAELTRRDADRFPYRVVPGPYVCISFEDTGHGMPEHVLAQAFEPFFTTKEPGKGTGLGLSTVYGIVKQSGGYLWASSIPDTGSTFQVYLPAVDDKPSPAAPSAPPAIKRGFGTVLLVEDEEAVRSVTRRLLEHAGYQVLEAASGTEAVRIFEEFEAKIDLLLTDVVMPSMGGAALAEHLVATAPGLRVLYMSGYADKRHVREGVDEGSHAFIQKPFSAEELLEKVRKALND